MSYRAIEKEYKALISQEKYEWLYRKRNWNDSFLQKNHYYDTEDLLLYRNNITFRIREVNNKMYIQTKCPNEQLVDERFLRLFLHLHLQEKRCKHQEQELH